MFGKDKVKECKHHFEARYSEENRDNNNYQNIEAQHITAEEFRSIFVIKKYVCDICTKCGKIVKDK